MGSKTGTPSAEHEEAPDHEQPKPAEPELEHEAPAQASGKVKFQLLADREATWGEAKYWKEFAIGHAWIRLIRADGSVDSWGYWPDIWSGHSVDPQAPWKSVPGKVLHPDTEHSPNAIQTTEIAGETADKVVKAANAKEASPGSYNLFSYNCTTFAADMAKLAGVPLPSFSTLGIANPNALFAGIEAKNRSRGLTPMETPLPRDGAVDN